MQQHSHLTSSQTPKPTPLPFLPHADAEQDKVSQTSQTMAAQVLSQSEPSPSDRADGPYPPLML